MISMTRLRRSGALRQPMRNTEWPSGVNPEWRARSILDKANIRSELELRMHLEQRRSSFIRVFGEVVNMSEYEAAVVEEWKRLKKLLDGRSHGESTAIQEG